VARARRRTLLGKWVRFIGQQRVYRTQDYLEIDDVEWYEVQPRRILYDEILLVTHHQAAGSGALVTNGLLLVLAVVVSLLVLSASPLAATVTFLASGLPLLTLFALRIVYPIQIVTVFGKRSRARMHFWLRQARAREVYETVCRLARERQERVARRAVRVPSNAEMPMPARD
jgi:hypothetical protein